MTQINWQFQVNNRAGGYIVTATDWNDYGSCFRSFIDQTTGSGTTDNVPLPIGIDLVNDRVYISDPDSATPENANHADTTLSVVGSSTFNGTMDLTSAVIQGASPFVFEGSSDNAHETTFAITDPTADRTITFKDGTGTVAFTSDITTQVAGSDHQVQFNDSGSFGADANFTYDGSATTLKATLTVGVDDTGHDVKFFGATSGAYMEWDESIDALVISGDDGHLSYGETAPTWKVEFATDDDLTSFTGTPKGGVCITNSQHDADDFTALDFGYTGSDNPLGRIATKVASGATSMHFGTSNDYSSGITNEAIRITSDGRVMMGSAIGSEGTFTNASLALGSNNDVTPDGSGNGHLVIDGNQYVGFVSLDGTVMWVGHNSAVRTVIIAPNETAVLSVTGNGYLNFLGNSTGAIRNSPTSGREILEIRSGGTSLTDGAGYNLYGDGDSSHPSKHIWFTDSSSSKMILTSSGLDVNGSLSKNSGSFDIAHPTKGGDWRLRHSFIGGPTCDNIYRGTVTISGSSATVDLDTVSNMTAGTFEALNTNTWSMVSSSGNAVTWSLSGKTLTINGPDNAVCSWMVIGERKDPTIIASDISDSNGKLIVEYEREEVIEVEEETD